MGEMGDHGLIIFFTTVCTVLLSNMPRLILLSNFMSAEIRMLGDVHSRTCLTHAYPKYNSLS